MLMSGNANLNNPLTVNHRIYVGNIDPSVTTSILETQFSTYGKILGISRKAPTFCFIEFSDEISAQKAIELENERGLGGRKVIVRKVIIKNDAIKRKSDQAGN